MPGTKQGICQAIVANVDIVGIIAVVEQSGPDKDIDGVKGLGG
jgi:hypothetical protein